MIRNRTLGYPHCTDKPNSKSKLNKTFRRVWLLTEHQHRGGMFNHQYSVYTFHTWQKTNRKVAKRKKVIDESRYKITPIPSCTELQRYRMTL